MLLFGETAWPPRALGRPTCSRMAVLLRGNGDEQKMADVNASSALPSSFAAGGSAGEASDAEFPDARPAFALSRASTQPGESIGIPPPYLETLGVPGESMGADTELLETAGLEQNRSASGDLLTLKGLIREPKAENRALLKELDGQRGGQHGLLENQGVASVCPDDLVVHNLRCEVADLHDEVLELQDVLRTLTGLDRIEDIVERLGDQDFINGVMDRIQRGGSQTENEEEQLRRRVEAQVIEIRKLQADLRLTRAELEESLARQRDLEAATATYEQGFSIPTKSNPSGDRHDDNQQIRELQEELDAARDEIARLMRVAGTFTSTRKYGQSINPDVEAEMETAEYVENPSSSKAVNQSINTLRQENERLMARLHQHDALIQQLRATVSALKEAEAQRLSLSRPPTMFLAATQADTTTGVTGTTEPSMLLSSTRQSVTLRSTAATTTTATTNLSPSRIRPSSLIAYEVFAAAAAAGDTDQVRKLLHVAGGRDVVGNTALMRAAGAGRADIVRMLAPLEAGVQRSDGWCALMEAAAANHAECIPYLAAAENGLRTNEGCVYHEALTALEIAHRENALLAAHMLEAILAREAPRKSLAKSK
ncbi:Ankyrin repeat protein 1 [Giardia muris]|uniref:Ankyrin repeat protein 1 n=1 Tax=Giardia muris TaxID=5742 RepID=A0A4Z1T3V6_GIAMU|nr:Ankyrin repeat protein 1 [Giardia muris]|eukprot:TNJ27727.1 Ankyrin repeat protein 1 [Giardia muris]